ncbi:hypothetical protein GGTG_12979 [Gaeumannomyces tritici R3-111a-1]|uniref:Uncharacterized protein n=1 Tax=Gaeumannomyces tritici (strain R3-111a-1) TaxID=644352 RepID=J3PHJ9_GAET3|nr:hypothetical protein GGTG_12979 [Gaeumannomyces tritici R3-111a-1]EJT69360.1 hypothetical protein GGTG_12979 [Gaeumannomyces tritici R3-111a-1]
MATHKSIRIADISQRRISDVVARPNATLQGLLWSNSGDGECGARALLQKARGQ